MPGGRPPNELIRGQVLWEIANAPLGRITVRDLSETTNRNYHTTRAMLLALKRDGKVVEDHDKDMNVRFYAVAPGVDIPQFRPEITNVDATSPDYKQPKYKVNQPKQIQATNVAFRYADFVKAFIYTDGKPELESAKLINLIPQFFVQLYMRGHLLKRGDYVEVAEKQEFRDYIDKLQLVLANTNVVVSQIAASPMLWDDNYLVKLVDEDDAPTFEEVVQANSTLLKLSQYKS